MGFYYYKVQWGNFCFTQILREIDFLNSRRAKLVFSRKFCVIFTQWGDCRNLFSPLFWKITWNQCTVFTKCVVVYYTHCEKRSFPSFKIYVKSRLVLLELEENAILTVSQVYEFWKLIDLFNQKHAKLISRKISVAGKFLRMLCHVFLLFQASGHKH